MRTLITASLFALAVGIVGCGGDKPKLVTVTGKVTHKGKTVTGGSVWFHPENATEKTEAGQQNSSGQLQIDGTFTVKTFPYGDGIPPGKYKVTLSPDLAARVGAPRYGTATKTPWSVTVSDEGVKDHTFEIK